MGEFRRAGSSATLCHSDDQWCREGRGDGQPCSWGSTKRHVVAHKSSVGPLRGPQGGRGDLYRHMHRFGNRCVPATLPALTSVHLASSTSALRCKDGETCDHRTDHLRPAPAHAVVVSLATSRSRVRLRNTSILGAGLPSPLRIILSTGLSISRLSPPAQRAVAQRLRALVHMAAALLG